MYLLATIGILWTLTALSFACPHVCECDSHGFVNCTTRNLTEVPKGIPPGTIFLDLSLNRISGLNISDFHHLVNVSSIYLTQNPISDDQIQDGAFELPNLDSLDLSNTKIRRIWKGLLSKSLRKLYVYQCKVVTIEPDSFSNAPLLDTLYLNQNKISTIPPGLFDNLRYLQTIQIAVNDIADDGIPRGIFSNLHNLTYLSVGFNRLQNWIPNLPTSLSFLGYGGNYIKSISAFAFQNLKNLHSMDITEGQLSHIEDNAFMGLKNLKYLELSKNNISTNLTEKTFSGLSSLERLDLDFNKISHVTPGALLIMKTMQWLSMDNNQITTLQPEALNSKIMPGLFEIDLNGNPWYCDCHLRWLKERSDSYNLPYIVNNPMIMTCAGPDDVAGKTWYHLKAGDFKC